MRARPYAGIGSATRPLEIVSVEMQRELAEESASAWAMQGVRVTVVARTISALKASATVWCVVVERRAK